MVDSWLCAGVIEKTACVLMLDLKALSKYFKYTEGHS